MDHTTQSRLAWAHAVSALVQRSRPGVLGPVPVPQNDPRTSQSLSR